VALSAARMKERMVDLSGLDIRWCRSILIHISEHSLECAGIDSEGVAPA
jgi:hypothetical protein